MKHFRARQQEEKNGKKKKGLEISLEACFSCITSGEKNVSCKKGGCPPEQRQETETYCLSTAFQP